MRISDWSSDVCSSDLPFGCKEGGAAACEPGRDWPQCDAFQPAAGKAQSEAFQPAAGQASKQSVKAKRPSKASKQSVKAKRQSKASKQNAQTCSRRGHTQTFTRPARARTNLTATKLTQNTCTPE